MIFDLASVQPLEAPSNSQHDAIARMAYAAWDHKLTADTAIRNVKALAGKGKLTDWELARLADLAQVAVIQDAHAAANREELAEKLAALGYLVGDVVTCGTVYVRLNKPGVPVTLAGRTLPAGDLLDDFDDDEPQSERDALAEAAFEYHEMTKV